MRLRRGAITADEFESELLYSLASQNEFDVGSLFNVIPEPHRTAIDERLKELYTHEFKWKPFFIGPGADSEGLEVLSNRLRAIYASRFNN